MNKLHQIAFCFVVFLHCSHEIESNESAISGGLFFTVLLVLNAMRPRAWG